MKQTRVGLVLQYVMDHEFATLSELCEHFNVSLYTIRRDIKLLQEQGLLIKVYGGVRAPAHQSELADSQHDAKRVIAQCAAELISDGDVVFLDLGTTTAGVVNALSDKRDVTLITNNLMAVQAAAKMRNLNVIMLPGVVNFTSKAVMDLCTVEFMDRYNIQTAVLATTGISPSGSVTYVTSLGYEIKRHAMSRVRRTILLADASKFGKSYLMTFAELTDMDYVVTDKCPPEAYRKLITGSKTRFIMPEREEAKAAVK